MMQLCRKPCSFSFLYSLQPVAPKSIRSCPHSKGLLKTAHDETFPFFIQQHYVMCCYPFYILIKKHIVIGTLFNYFSSQSIGLFLDFYISCYSKIFYTLVYLQNKFKTKFAWNGQVNFYVNSLFEYVINITWQNFIIRYK
jgi:hypothetical protein